MNVKQEIIKNLNIKSYFENEHPSPIKWHNDWGQTNCHKHFPDKIPSLFMNKKNGNLYCKGCKYKASIFDYHIEKHGVDFKTALEELGRQAGITEPKKKIAKIYDYTDAEGNLIFQCVRYEPKDFRQRRPDGKGGWIYNLQGITPIPYNLPEVVKADTVFIPEGEKDCENLKQLGFTASCNPMGAGKWKPEYNQCFKGKKVYILPDNDKVGKDHALQVAKNLKGMAESVKIVELPDLPEKGDVSDWITNGGTKEKLAEIINNTSEWTEDTQAKSFLSSLERWDYIQSLNIIVEWIIDRLIPKGSIILIFGKGGIGKTWLLMCIARCIGNGISFLGLTTKKTIVIFIDFENPLAVLNTRTKKIGDTDNVYFWRANNEKLKPPKLDSADWEIYKTLPKGAVLIFDTLRSSHGQDENSSDGMALIMGRLKELRDMGFTIILLHHTAKNSDKIAKGSTAIVDLSDHILGLTLVRKKRDGHDIVIDDEEDEEDTVYKFGVREKTRFEPYHIYLTLNPDRGFELAPDPQEDTLKEMHRILTEHGNLSKSAIIERCKGLGIGINRLRKLVELGQGRYWQIERGDKHSYLVTPIQLVNSTPYIGGVGLTNYKDTSKNTPVELDSQNSLKTPVNTKLVNSTEVVYPINQLNLMEVVI